MRKNHTTHTLTHTHCNIQYHKPKDINKWIITHKKICAQYYTVFGYIRINIELHGEFVLKNIEESLQVLFAIDGDVGRIWAEM